MKIGKILGVALCGVLCCADAAAENSVAEKDAADFAAVSSLLPDDGMLYRIINLRNLKYYGKQSVSLLINKIMEDPELWDTVCMSWDLLGLDAIRVVGVADTPVSVDDNVWETVVVGYSGEPLPGLAGDTFRGKFDTVKAAGSWPVSTIVGCRSNMRFSAAAREYHEKVEPLPLPVIEVIKAVSGRYSLLVAEDADGVMLDIIMPDNQSSFVFYTVKAFLAQEPGMVTADNDKIILKNSTGDITWDIVIFRHKNMIRICNGMDVPARLKAMEKLKDNKDFNALTAGIAHAGDSVVYYGEKILNPVNGVDFRTGEFDYNNIFVNSPWDSRLFSKLSFTDFGIEEKTRTFNSMQVRYFEGFKKFLHDLENNIENMDLSI